MAGAGEGVPLWRQVLTDLETRLASGELSDRFPTDRELVEHYGTSRHTVREAVRHLKARGIIERERGRGSTVTGTRLTQPLGALYNLFAAVEEAGRTQRSEVLALDLRPDAAAAGRLGLEPATPLVHLERLRFIDDDPLAVDTTWLPPDVGRPLLDADFSATSLYDELHRRTGIRPDAGQEQLSAVIPDPAMAEVLHLDPDEALLRIDRLTSAASRMIECRLTLLRSSRMAVVSHWPGPSEMTGALRDQTGSDG